MGPTASGKTNLAISLVKQLPCDIISVDSAMVFKGMDIGTAKPSAEELAQAPHRLIDILDPSQPYSAGQFCADATREIRHIQAQGRIPLLVGGTMLYFRALQQGMASLPQADPVIRNKLTQQAEEQGWQALYERLIEIDPDAAKRIDSNDKQRIQRALEIYELTGKSASDAFISTQSQFSPSDFLSIALIPADRQVLHDKIALRFTKMLEQGLVEEVERLYQRGDLNPDMPSIRSVGYRQVWQYLQGDLTLEQAEERAVIATRQLAKRQLTWLRSWQSIHTLNADGLNLDKSIITLLRNKS
jgi:tRNA dimethylallyltransferase